MPGQLHLVETIVSMVTRFRSAWCNVSARSLRAPQWAFESSGVISDLVLQNGKRGGDTAR